MSRRTHSAGVDTVTAGSPPSSPCEACHELKKVRARASAAQRARHVLTLPSARTSVPRVPASRTARASCPGDVPRVAAYWQPGLARGTLQVSHGVKYLLPDGARALAAAARSARSQRANVHVWQHQQRDCVQRARRLLLRYQWSVLDEQSWMDKCFGRDPHGLLHLLRIHVQRLCLGKAVRVPHLALLVRSAEASHLRSQLPPQQQTQRHHPIEPGPGQPDWVATAVRSLRSLWVALAQCLGVPLALSACCTATSSAAPFHLAWAV